MPLCSSISESGKEILKLSVIQMEGFADEDGLLGNIYDNGAG